MGERFFEIASPRDLFYKAKRDYKKMKSDTSTDTIFNFFVTTYHIVDYVKVLRTVSNMAIDQLLADADFKMCRFLCDKGKHIRLKRGEPYEAQHQPAIQGGIVGQFVLDADCLGGGPEKFVVLDGTQEVSVIDLGKRLIDKWEAFFATHGIS